MSFITVIVPPATAMMSPSLFVPAAAIVIVPPHRITPALLLSKSMFASPIVPARLAPI